MKAIFIVTGLPNSGRDTFVRYIRQSLVRANSISYVKILEDKMKCISPKKPTKRQEEYLKKIKDLLIYSSIITSAIVDRIHTIDNDKTIFFIKTNNPEDITIIRRAFPKKVKVVYIDRNLKWNYINFLPSDFKYDYKVDNIGTLEDFKKNIQHFIMKKVPSRMFFDDITFRPNTE